MSKHWKIIQELAAKYEVEVCRVNQEEHRNRGVSAGSSISLGRFDDGDIELVAFFHELGHCKWKDHVGFTRTRLLCTISSEGCAWELGLGLASQEGYRWNFYSKELRWARAQLLSYNKDEHFQPYGEKPQ